MRGNRSESVPVKSISRQGICSARLSSIGQGDEAPPAGRTFCACRTPLLAAAILAVSFAAISLSATSAQARVIYWDPSSPGTFGSVTGTDIWMSPLDKIWTTSNTGGSTRLQNYTTTLSDDCNFGGPVAALGGGTIPVDIVNAGTISFNVIKNKPILLSGGQITLKSATSIANNATTYTHTITSVLAGAATSLTKTGPGAVILSGANTYTGVTIVSAGTLTLDYGTENNSKLADAAGLVLGGGTVNLSGGSHLETVASTTLTAGMPSGVTSSTLGSVLQMKDITRNVAATINFGAASIASTSTANTSGILGAWATVGGADWAANSGTDDGGAVGNSFITAYTGYTDIDAMGGGANPNIVDGSGTNVRIHNAGVSGAIGLSAADTTVNTLLQNTAVAATVDTAGGALRTGGIMIGSGKEALTIGVTAGDGALTAATDGGELVLINYNAAKALTVNAVIADNSTLACPLTKAGTGTLVLTGANSHTGLTTVNAGVLKLGAAGDATNSPLGTTAAGTSVTSGAALDLAGFSIGTDEALTLNGTGVSNGGALTNSGAAAAYSGLITLGSASSIEANNGDIVLSNTISVATFGLTLGGTGNGSITGSIATGSGTLTKADTGTWTLSGNNTYTGLTTVSAGTLTLSGNNTGTGGTTLTAGTLNVNDNHALGNSGRITLSGGTIDNTSGSAMANAVANPITLGGNFAFSTAAGTANNDLDLGSGAVTNSGNRTITLNGAGALTFAGIMTNTLKNNNTLTVNNGSGTTATSAVNFGGYVLSGTASTARTDTITGSGNVNITGPVTDVSSGTAASSLTKAGTGTLTLTGTNTYTGATTVNGGTLLINSPGSLDANSAVTVNTGGTLGGDGTIGGAVTVKNDGAVVWDFNGTTGTTLALLSDLQLDTGWKLTLTSSGAGTPSGEYDLFTYTGTFGGDLAGIIDDSAVTGWPTPMIRQDTTPGAGRIYLKFGTPGDTNGDFLVDAADYITLKKNFGAGVGGGAAAGNFDETGTVNWADLSTLMSNIGPVGGAPAAPEPCSAMLLVFGAAALLRRNRRS